MIRYFVFTVFLAINTINVYSQVNIESDSVCQYTIDNRFYSCHHISIKNSTDEIVLCWLVKDTILSNKDPFYSYFFNQMGEFCLYNIITEYGGTLDIDKVELFPQLFKTFYKVINPYSSFEVYFLENATKHLEIEKMIQVASLKNYKKYFDNTMLEPFRRLSYKPNYIVISTRDFEK